MTARKPEVAKAPQADETVFVPVNFRQAFEAALAPLARKGDITVIMAYGLIEQAGRLHDEWAAKEQQPAA